jgi:catechol 2,3-dioxygenase-like lactoylglutathione lyase family enzyme
VLKQVNVIVKDMEASVAFYRLLGIEIPDADPAWEDDHRSAQAADGFAFDLDTAESTKKWDRGWPDRPGGGASVLGFGVASRDRVDTLHAELTSAGYRSQQEPYDAFWGSRYAVVEDPDGNAIGLMSPRDPAYRVAQTPS